MRLLESEDHSLSCWMRAARRGDTDALRRLAPPTASQQLPPLCLGSGSPAVSAGRVSSLEARRGGEGPALFVAAEHGHAPAILLLLGMGARTSFTSPQVRNGAHTRYCVQCLYGIGSVH
jgi:hypothetical protein